MDFNEVPVKIEILKKTSPQIAKYFKVEYLWWKMISTFNSSTEALLLSELSSLHDKNSENENYNKLILFHCIKSDMIISKRGVLPGI